MRDATAADFIVVGAGIMGAATTWALTKRGRRVILLEQYGLDHVRGSSHGCSRIFRLAYDSSVYVHLAQKASRDWAELEHESGRELLRRTGAFDLGPPGLLGPIENVLQACGAPVERVSSRALHRRFPAVGTPDGWEAVFQPDGGVLSAAACREAFLDLSEAAGACIFANCRAVRVAPSAGRATVQTEDGNEYSAAAIVVTAAGWAPGLVRPLGIDVPLRVTREHVAYYPLLHNAPFFPFIWHIDEGTPEFYGLPNAGDGTVKIGQHLAGKEIEPDHYETADRTLVAPLDSFVATHLQNLRPESVLAETCLYATSPDDGFVIDRAGPVVVGLGFGGHGFKFAPTVGRMLADLACNDDIDFRPEFSMSRYNRRLS